MSQVFYAQYEVRPLPSNELWKTAGGAFVHCYVVASAVKEAGVKAASVLKELDWEVVAVESEPVELCREAIHTTEAREQFDLALSGGESFVYHLWSAEDDDAMH